MTVKCLVNFLKRKIPLTNRASGQQFPLTPGSFDPCIGEWVSAKGKPRLWVVLKEPEHS